MINKGIDIPCLTDMGIYNSGEIPKHKLIARYIMKHPGSSFGEISDILGINASTLKYHLDRLEKDERISSRKIGRKRFYYPVGEPRSGDAQLTKVQKRVMLVIKENPGISRSEICSITGSNSSSVGSALKVLVRKGKVTKVKIKGSVVYEYVSKKVLKQRLFRELLARLIDGEMDERTFRLLLDQLDRDLK